MLWEWAPGTLKYFRGIIYLKFWSLKKLWIFFFLTYWPKLYVSFFFIEEDWIGTGLSLILEFEIFFYSCYTLSNRGLGSHIRVTLNLY